MTSGDVSERTVTACDFKFGSPWTPKTRVRCGPRGSRQNVSAGDLLDDMRAACARHGSDFVPTPGDAVIGVADNVQPGTWPVNGLRHRLGSTSGWFIWAGDETSEEADFFKSTHAAHLIERCPEAMTYLGLAPSFRFLIAPDYEDVWIDTDLLEHEV